MVGSERVFGEHSLTFAPVPLGDVWTCLNGLYTRENNLSSVMFAKDPPIHSYPKSVNTLVPCEHPAAMQHGGQLRLQYPVGVFLFSIIVTLIGS
uniref:Uncharacterized protein n=2 Tax=Timema TaxID=61471 RepID=A0A7R9CLK9_TIMPO|nr:unnamed protein product [Timema douglasi]CAD7398789.1 unnamed protein product [Timema poppensis]